MVGVHADAEAHAQHALLARGQAGEHASGGFSQIALDRGVQRLNGVLVLDEIAEMAVFLVADRGFQADWLLRFYGFSVDEIVTKKNPNLDLNYDPKTSWALRNPQYFPVDLNTAPREMLLRVPGLGVRNVTRILKIRKWHALSLSDLGKLRVSMKKVMPYIELLDHTPKSLDITKISEPRQPAQQLDLFAGVSAVTGEV